MSNCVHIIASVHRCGRCMRQGAVRQTSRDSHPDGFVFVRWQLRCLFECDDLQRRCQGRSAACGSPCLGLICCMQWQSCCAALPVH
jgi:hypothetical protein